MIRRLGWTWSEILSAHGRVSPMALCVVFEEVFDEEAYFRAHYGALKDPRRKQFPFSERCAASDCGHLAEVVSISGGPALWDAMPRKRLSASIANWSRPGAPIDISKFRLPGHLTLEFVLRGQLRNISRSWRSISSGIVAWAVFSGAFTPFSDPWSPSQQDLAAFAAHFRNGDTLGKYISNLRLACRLQHRPLEISEQLQVTISALKRARPKAPRPAYDARAVRSLVKTLLDKDLVLEARFLAVSRQFMLRVASEGRPLQPNGLTSREEDPCWHSAVSSEGSEECTISLRRRKNSDVVCTLSRPCVCTSPHVLLCGVCALRAQVRAHSLVGRSDTDELFPVNMDSLRSILSDALGKPFSWHGLRRGMAQDLVAWGASLGTILRQGGWRSAAFLKYLSISSVKEQELTDLVINMSDSD